MYKRISSYSPGVFASTETSDWLNWGNWISIVGNLDLAYRWSFAIPYCLNSTFPSFPSSEPSALRERGVPTMVLRTMMPERRAPFALSHLFEKSLHAGRWRLFGSELRDWYLVHGWGRGRTMRGGVGEVVGTGSGSWRVCRVVFCLWRLG